MREIEEQLLIVEEGETPGSRTSRNHASIKRIRKNKYLACAGVLATTGGILFGYDLGVMSGALIQIKHVFGLTCFQQEMTISSMIIGALVTSLFAGYIVDGFGRKTTIIASSLLYGIGGAIVTIAPNYNILIFGRLILGSAISLSSTSECVYVSEISPAKYRGTIVSSNELGITVGFLLAFCSNAIFAFDTMNGWRWMFASSLVFAFVMLLMGCWLPRSPRYLLMKGQIQEAKMILSKIRDSDVKSEAFTNEWEAMLLHINSAQTLQGFCTIFRNPAAAYSLFLGFSLMFMQQCTGQPNLLFYASTVLISFDFDPGIIASICSIVLGLAKLISTIICMSIVEKYDRKSFLIVGCFIMSVALIIIAVCAISFDIGALKACSNVTLSSDHNYAYTNMTDFVYHNIVHTSRVRWIVLLALIAFVSAYAFSFGPVAWIFLGEIFPTNIRGKGFSFATSFNWGVQLLFSSTFLHFAKACGGVGWPFLLNSILIMLSIIFLFKFIPKTKGKSLEEIQDDMKHRGVELFGTSFDST